MDYCQVLIVGAGPVGLTMAAYLHHFGVTVRIIDKNDHATLTSNAVGVHARTMELLNIIGLTEKFSSTGKHIESVKFVTKETQIAKFDFSKLETNYNYICDLPQSETEALLLGYLKEKNISVERQTHFLMFEETDKGVLAKLQKDNEQFAIHCDWLIACDGYHSTIREQLKIAYEGEDLSFHCLMIDAPVTWDHSLDSMYLSFTNDLSIALFPMLQSVRMIAEVSHCPQYKEVQTPDEKIFTEIVQKCLPGKMLIDKPLWNSNFWIHERLAAHYQQGKVFLVGDAAHVHSPAGGQGMNTGMQDAINLSWKLAWILKNHSPPELLASYENERRNIAAGVIKMSGMQSKIAFSRHPMLSTLRNFLLPHITHLNYVQQKMIHTISELSIHYRESRLTAGKKYGLLRPGDRFPGLPDQQLGLRYLLLDFTGDSKTIVQPYLDKIVVKQSVDSDGFTMSQGYCLIRPDFYIGYLGEDKQQLADYLRKVM